MFKISACVLIIDDSPGGGATFMAVKKGAGGRAKQMTIYFCLVFKLFTPDSLQNMECVRNERKQFLFFCFTQVQSCSRVIFY